MLRISSYIIPRKSPDESAEGVSNCNANSTVILQTKFGKMIVLCVHRCAYRKLGQRQWTKRLLHWNPTLKCMACGSCLMPSVSSDKVWRWMLLRGKVAFTASKKVHELSCKYVPLMDRWKIIEKKVNTEIMKLKSSGLDGASSSVMPYIDSCWQQSSRQICLKRASTKNQD